VLVVVATAGILFAAIGNAIFNHMLDARRLETSQRLRENFSRFQYLVSIEGSEAKRVETVQSSFSGQWSLPPCNGISSRTPYFELVLPNSEGTYANSAQDKSIFYYQGGLDIRRCGPTVNRNGTLRVGSDGSYVDSIVLKNASLDVVKLSPGCGVAEDELTNNRQVVYRLNFENSSVRPLSKSSYSLYRPPCVVARAKTVFICNPPTSASSSGSIGICEVGP
jgi:hypothetical protein